MITRLGEIFDRATVRDVFKPARITGIGLELEGVFPNTAPFQGKMVPDGSVKWFPASLRTTGDYSWAEIPSPVCKTPKVAMDFIHDYYPVHVNATCGFHIHTSTKPQYLTNVLATAESAAYILRAMKFLLNMLEMRVPHSCQYVYDAAHCAIPETPQTTPSCYKAFEYRLLGQNHFCNVDLVKLKYTPLMENRDYPVMESRDYNKKKIRSTRQTLAADYEYQAIQRGKTRDTRYSMLNFCTNYHGTLEMRLFPMFCTAEIAQIAAHYYLQVLDWLIQRTLSRRFVIKREVKKTVTKEEMPDVCDSNY